jgi:hypothetical protein
MIKSKKRPKQQRSRTKVAIKDPQLLSEILQGCSPACADQLRELHRLASTGTTRTLTVMWRQGQVIERLRDREMTCTENELARVNPVLLASRILERDVRYVNRVGQFFRAFPRKEELECVLSLRLADTGRPLSWPHFEQLLKVFSEDGLNNAFDLLLRKTIENSWSPDDIETHLKNTRRANGEEESRGGGRPTVIPATFDKKVTRLTAHAGILAKNAEEIYLHKQHSLLASIQRMSQHEVAQRADELKAAMVRIEEMGREVQEMFKRLETEQFPEARKFIQDCVSFFAKENRGDAA